MSEPLVLSFKSDTNDARNAIASLASSVVTNMMTIGSAMKAANDNVGTLQKGIAALPTILKTAAAAFIAFEAAKIAIGAVSHSIDEARAKLKELVDVGQGARDAGVGTDLFQRWTSHAAELNTTAERLAATLQHARDAAQISLGEGGGPNQSPFQARLAQQLAAGNINAGDVGSYNAAGSQEERIKNVLDLVERLNQEGKALAALDIAGHFFGADFEQRLRDGTNAVAKMREDLDGVTKAKWPPEMVQRAEELNHAIEKAKATMADGILPIQRDIANGQLDLLQYTKEWYEFWGRVLDTAGRMYVAVKDIGAKFDEISHSAFFSELKKLGDLYDKATGAVARAGAQTGYRLGLRGLPQEDESAAYQFNQADRDAGENLRTLTVGGKGRRDTSKPLPKKDTSSTESADEVDTYIKSLQKAVEVLKAENETFGKSNTVKAEAVDLEKALAAARTRGTALTDEERAKVKALADEEGAAKDKAEELRKALEGANARATFLGDQAISAIERIGQAGVRAKDVVLDFAKALEKAALQAALLGTGPLAQLFGTAGRDGNVGGLFGGLFGGGGFFGGGSRYGAADYGAAEAAAAPGMYGPAFASGGLVGRDGERTFIPFAALAGARHFDSGGGIPAILHPGEIVLNAAQQGNVANSMGMGGAKINLTHAPTINGTGLSAEQVFAVIQRSQKDFARQIGPIFSDWQRRHG